MRTSDIIEPRRWTARWCEVLLIVMVFFAIAGDPPPNVNEAHYLSRAKHFWDPGWCAGDLFLESPDAHGLFVWTFGAVTKWLSLPATAWVGRLLAWAMLAWAWQRLSWRLVPAPLVSVLGAALWVTLTSKADLAGEWAVGGVETKCFAYVFVLVALRSLADRQWNSAWIALGTASAFHVLVGGWSMVVFGGIWLVEQLKGSAGSSPCRAWWSMLPGLAIGGLIALLGLVPALALEWHQPPEIIAKANLIYVFERLPHHLSPLTLPTGEFLRRFLRHGLLIVGLWGLTRANRRAGSDSIQGLRMINWFAWGSVLLAAIGLSIEIALWYQPQTAAALLRYYWFRLSDVAVPLAFALEAEALIVYGIQHRKRWAAGGLAGAIAVTGWYVGTETTERLAEPIPPADARMRDAAAWADACQWIAESTPKDAVFLTPRLTCTFKWRTGRAEVATHKDIPQDARSMVEWFDRLRDIYYYELGERAEPFNSVGELGTERAVELAHRYGARYIVSDQGHPLALKRVYPNREHPNDEYVVYDLKD